MASRIVPGLVSVSFRHLDVVRVVAAAVQAGLEAIEWGADIHVPPSDAANAERTRGLTHDAGLRVSSYGSYFRVGRDSLDAFAPVLATARTLGAPTLRVWAGPRASADTDARERRAVVKDLREICRRAAGAGIRIAMEFHAHTLTDTVPSTLALLEEVADANLHTYWQPPVGESDAERLAGLTSVLPVVTNLHVFHWGPGHERQPLADGAALWTEVLRLCAETEEPRFALLEFVRHDSLDALLADAATLRGWILALQ